MKIDMDEKIRIGVYANTKEYPKHPSFKCSQCDLPLGRLCKFCSDCGTATNFAEQEVEYNRKRNEYYNADSEIYDQFKEDALAEIGLIGHPKADILFSKAYERGHSSGYSEVWYYMQDLAELVD
jgi:hypothetical protein